jgi:thiol-disulfide isomerase/thioredoxin
MRIDYLSGGLLLLIAAAALYAVLGGNGLLVSRESLPEMLPDMPGTMPEEEVRLPNLGKAPELAGISSWINTEPLRNEDLRGRVVLIDFWTYSCINCIRTFPYIQSWHEKYQNKGLVLLGVHTPEFNFERERANVAQAAQEHGLSYPIAMDNDYVTWNAFHNHFWPAHYLIDVDGTIRYRHFGEGNYAETEQAIQSLLREANLLDPESKIAVGEETELAARRVLTPETYLGYQRIDNFGGPRDFSRDAPDDFTMPHDAARNTFYLDGQWVIGPESAELAGASGTIRYTYFANQANLVMAPPAGGSAMVELLLDGQPLPREMAGADVVFAGEAARVTVDASKLYSLTDSTGGEWHTLELRVLTPGLQAFAFTFG